MTGYAPAGYITDPTEMIRGLSPLHDSGTGASTGIILDSTSRKAKELMTL